jgi:hypothetical protein
VTSAWTLKRPSDAADEDTIFVFRRSRFLVAYGLLVFAVATSGVATWKLAAEHRPGPLAPGAVDLVERFLASVQQGDLKTACRLFSALPACDPAAYAPPLRTYEVFPAEAAVGGVDVPATLDGEYVLFSIASRLGGYRIVDVIADPSAFSSGPTTPLVA